MKLYGLVDAPNGYGQTWPEDTPAGVIILELPERVTSEGSNTLAYVQIKVRNPERSSYGLLILVHNYTQC